MDIEDLKKLLSPKTRLVACTHASNILGTINDVKAIAETVHTVKGAMLMVDGVAFAPHRVIDVKELGVDFYSFSWYKVRFSPSYCRLFSLSFADDLYRCMDHTSRCCTVLHQPRRILSH